MDATSRLPWARSPSRSTKPRTGCSGDLSSGQPPLIALHGGPSVTHFYLLPFSALVASHGIPVILYDQLGCGESTHLREKPADVWTIELFLSELENLLERLEVKEYSLLGHSWGGILAQEWAARKPAGLKKLILTDSFPAMPLWVESTKLLVAQLPEEAQEAIKVNEAAGKLDAPEYRGAVGLFYSKHLCTLQPWPEVLGASFAQVMQDPTVPTAMLGAAAFNVTGKLKDWSIVPRLSEIAIPTLVTYGRPDQAGAVCQRALMEEIKGATEKAWEKSSHMPWLKEGEAYLEYVGEWLKQ